MGPVTCTENLFLLTISCFVNICFPHSSLCKGGIPHDKVHFSGDHATFPGQNKFQISKRQLFKAGCWVNSTANVGVCQISLQLNQGKAKETIPSQIISVCTLNHSPVSHTNCQRHDLPFSCAVTVSFLPMIPAIFSLVC